jgi:hypothetical protein
VLRVLLDFLSSDGGSLFGTSSPALLSPLHVEAGFCFFSGNEGLALLGRELALPFDFLW